jgi:hypothetical protein
MNNEQIPLSTEEFIAGLRGKSIKEVEAYRAVKKIEHEISLKSKKYKNKPPSEWPQITFNWDITIASQRFALDGVNQNDFATDYPNGFKLAWVNLKALDSKLCRHSKRNFPKELWGIGCKNKLAYLIAYLSEDRAISPPLIRVIKEKEIAINGGNHRFAVAKAIGLERIPVYYVDSEKDQLFKLLDEASDVVSE